MWKCLVPLGTCRHPASPVCEPFGANHAGPSARVPPRPSHAQSVGPLSVHAAVSSTHEIPQVAYLSPSSCLTGSSSLSAPLLWCRCDHSHSSQDHPGSATIPTPLKERPPGHQKASDHPGFEIVHWPLTTDPVHALQRDAVLLPYLWVISGPLKPVTPFRAAGNGATHRSQLWDGPGRRSASGTTNRTRLAS